MQADTRIRQNVGPGIWLALTLALAGCRGTPQTPETPRAANRPSVVRVQTAPVQTISVQRQVDIVGTMMSPDQAKISSEVAGVVREVLVELGSEVKAGQLLVRLKQAASLCAKNPIGFKVRPPLLKEASKIVDRNRVVELRSFAHL